MSFSDVKTREFRFDTSVGENQREKVFKEYYLPTANLAFYNLIKNVLDDCNAEPSRHCLVENEPGANYYTFTFVGGVQINHHTDESTTYNVSEDEKLAKKLFSELYKSVGSVMNAIVTNQEFNRLPNLWYDYFCIMRILMDVLEIKNNYISTVVQLGKLALVKTVIGVNLHKMKTDVENDEIEYVKEDVRGVEKHYVKFNDIMGKPYRYIFNLRISGPRIVSENKTNMMGYFSMDINDVFDDSDSDHEKSENEESNDADDSKETEPEGDDSGNQEAGTSEINQDSQTSQNIKLDKKPPPFNSQIMNVAKNSEEKTTTSKSKPKQKKQK